MSKGTDRRTVRVAPELWEAARAVADERGESLSDVIRWRLVEYIREQPQITVDLARERLSGSGLCEPSSSTYGTAPKTTDRSTKRTGDGTS